MRRLFDAARTRLGLLASSRQVDARATEEFSFHIDMEAERIAREQGVSLDEARRRALATFGGRTQHGEALREGRGLAWLGSLTLDARLAGRMLRKSPGLTVIAVIGMSVAVAIGCVCFSAVYRLADAELPVDQGDRVVGIRNIDRRQADDARATHLHYLPLWRDAMTSLEEIGAYRNLSRNIVTTDGWSEAARVAEITASGFRIARVAPAAGRYLVDADERPGAPPVAVIGHRVWQQRYAGAAGVVGQYIQIGDTRHVIVGIMPEGFAFPVNNRIWIPLRLNPAEYEPFRAPFLDVFGRLADGASLNEARRQVELVGQRLAATDSVTHGALRQRVIPYTHTFIDNAESTWMYHLVQLIVAALLAVIGTNVAVLVYARTAGRMGEIAVRTSLGASRARIVGQLFAEALALSLVAAAVGVFVAWLAMKQIDGALQNIAGEQLPYWMRLQLTPGVVFYAIGLAVVAALIIGVIPALKVTGGRMRTSLQELSNGGSSLRLGRPWTIMIVAQVAIAVALLPLAIAGISAWGRAEAAQATIASRQILTAWLSYDLPPEVRMDTAEARVRHVSLRSQVIERLRADARVGSLVLASNAPGEEEDYDFLADESNSVVAASSITGAGETFIQPEYLSLVGMRVLAGRGFEPADLSPTANVVLVNRSFIKKMFGGQAALGARIRYANRRSESDTTKPAPWQTIVGIVSDFPVDSSATAPRIYKPLDASRAWGVMVAIRMNGANAADLIPALRRHTLQTSPLLRLDQIRTMEKAVEESTSGMRLTIFVMELVTLSVILLSAAGIYALMAFTITRRRREIGIRAALGAAPRRLLAGEMSRVMAQIAVGIMIGIGIAGVLDHSLQGGWTGRRGYVGLAMVALLMIAIGIISALRPAIGALRIQPTEALRSD